MKIQKMLERLSEQNVILIITKVVIFCKIYWK